MTTVKLLWVTCIFSLTLVCTACGNSNQENPDKNVLAGINATADSLAQASRDSVAKQAAGTPSASVSPEPY